jgi:hypothetical protein
MIFTLYTHRSKSLHCADKLTYTIDLKLRAALNISLGFYLQILAQKQLMVMNN